MNTTKKIIISLLTLSVMMILSMSVFADGMSVSLETKTSNLTAGDTFDVDIKFSEGIQAGTFTFEYDHTKLELVEGKAYDGILDVDGKNSDGFAWYSPKLDLNDKPMYAIFKIKEDIAPGETIEIGLKDVEVYKEGKSYYPEIKSWSGMVLSSNNNCSTIKVTAYATEADRSNGIGGVEYFASPDNGNFLLDYISYETLYFTLEAITDDEKASVKYSAVKGKLKVDGTVELNFTVSAENGSSKKYTVTLKTQTCVHEYVELDETYVAPSCTVSGSVKERCIACGSEKTKLIEKEPHNYIQTVFAPTCVDGGYTLNVCAFCADTYRSDETSASGHSYVVESTTSTCITLGESQYKCSSCGAGHSAKDTNYASHKYASKVIDPTCTDAGKTVHTCEICSESYEDAYTDAAGHKYIPTVTESTCTTAGYTTFTCEGCQHKYVDKYTSALGHNYGEWKTEVAATAEKDGVAKRTCAACTETEAQVLPKLVEGASNVGEGVGATNWQNIIIIILAIGVIVLLILLFVMYFTFKIKSSIRNIPR